MLIKKLLPLFILTLPLTTQASPPAQVINLMDVKADEFDRIERFNRKSDALPLTLDELTQLQKAGVKSPTLMEMMRTRRVMAVADAPTLLNLKKAGASDDMIAALSAYVVKPNDHFKLNIVLNLLSPGSMAQAPYLYIEIWNPRKRRQEAILYADLRDKLTDANTSLKGSSDRGDPLLANNLARINLSSRIRSRGAGPLDIRVLIGQEAGLMTLSSSDGKPLKGVETYSISYPAVSLDNRCQAEIQLSRDSVMRERYAISQGRVHCRWD
ncbi:MAG: hypothetical protein CMH52_08260 [Myxococcales bacterium]|nr:hypothetical protein [Myxococcales bacterium]